LRHDPCGGRANQRHQHGDGLWDRRRDHRGQSAAPGRQQARSADLCARADDSRGGIAGASADRADREAADGELQHAQPAAVERAGADRWRVGPGRRRGLSEARGLCAVMARPTRVDRLGTLLALVVAAALALLPFVVFKTNRIVPGEPKALAAVLPGWATLGLYACLSLVAAVAVCLSSARIRFGASL